MAKALTLHPAALEPVDKRVRSLYYIMQSVESNLGGGEGLEGIYGTLTRHYMQLVLDALETHCGLAACSSLIDVGSGLGRPLLHACVSHGLTACHGIEIDFIKCAKANAFVALSAQRLKAKMAGPTIVLPSIQCCAIEEVPELTASHVFSFWEGIPVEARCALGRLVAASPAVQGVAVCQRAMRGGHPEAVMREMGFGSLKLVETFPVSMAGRGQRFVAYIFSRNASGKATKLAVPSKSPMSTASAAAAEVTVKSPPSLSQLNLGSPIRSPKRKPPPVEDAAGPQMHGSPPKKPAHSKQTIASRRAAVPAPAAAAVDVGHDKAAQAPAGAARLRHALAASRIPVSPAATSASRQLRSQAATTSSPPSAIPSPPPLNSLPVPAHAAARQALQDGRPASATHQPPLPAAAMCMRRGPMLDPCTLSLPEQRTATGRQNPVAAATHAAATIPQADRAAHDGISAASAKRRSPRRRAGSRQTRLALPVTKDLGPAPVHAANLPSAPAQLAGRKSSSREAVAAVAAAGHTPTTTPELDSLPRAPQSKRVTRQSSLRQAAASAGTKTHSQGQDPNMVAAVTQVPLHDSTNALAAPGDTRQTKQGTSPAHAASTQPPAGTRLVPEQRVRAKAAAAATAGQSARTIKISAAFQQQKRATGVQGKSESYVSKDPSKLIPSYGLGLNACVPEPSKQRT